MSYSIVTKTAVQYNANGEIYDTAPSNLPSYDYILNFTSGSLNNLLAGSKYQQNSVNSGQVDINMVVNATLPDQISCVMNNIGVSTAGSFSSGSVGEALLEILAIKLFGNTQARSAIQNDNNYVSNTGLSNSNLASDIANSLNNALQNDSSDIFNQYVHAGTYENINSNDVNKSMDFNFSGLNLAVPMWFNGSVTSNGVLLSNYNGPNVGGNKVLNGNYSIPLLLVFN